MLTKVETDYTVVVGNRIQILEWISLIPYSSHHKTISEKRVLDTGKWLLLRPEYLCWKASSISELLLLRGIRTLSFPLPTFNKCCGSNSPQRVQVNRFWGMTSPMYH